MTYSQELILSCETSRRIFGGNKTTNFKYMLDYNTIQHSRKIGIRIKKIYTSFTKENNADIKHPALIFSKNSKVIIYFRNIY